MLTCQVSKLVAEFLGSAHPVSIALTEAGTASGAPFPSDRSGFSSAPTSPKAKLSVDDGGGGLASGGGLSLASGLIHGGISGEGGG